jgi:hypothetical protein
MCECGHVRACIGVSVYGCVCVWLYACVNVSVYVPEFVRVCE